MLHINAACRCHLTTRICCREKLFSHTQLLLWMLFGPTQLPFNAAIFHVWSRNTCHRQSWPAVRTSKGGRHCHVHVWKGHFPKRKSKFCVHLGFFMSFILYISLMSRRANADINFNWSDPESEQHNLVFGTTLENFKPAQTFSLLSDSKRK